MLHTIVFSITAGQINGTTLVNLPLPAADTTTGVIAVDVGTGNNMGGVNPDMLKPLVGEGGYLVTGLGANLMAGPTTWYAGIALQTSGNVLQAVPPFTGTGVSPSAVPWIDTPFYVPPGWRLFFLAGSDVTTGNATIRIDLLPLRDPEQAARALRCVPPGLFVPITPLPT